MYATKSNLTEIGEVIDSVPESTGTLGIGMFTEQGIIEPITVVQQEELISRNKLTQKSWNDYVNNIISSVIDEKIINENLLLLQSILSNETYEIDIIFYVIFF